MKKWTLLLLFVVFGLIAKSQNNSPIIITPGVGVGNLKLGMSEEEAKKILQVQESDINWSNYNQQMEKFVGWNIAIDSTVQFLLGFDSCARFENNVSEVMPVFALYFKNHKLNFITVSSYVGDEDLIKLVKVNNGLTYYDSMNTCISKFGKEYLNISPGDNTADMFYYKKGIELVIDDNQVRSIGIFPALPGFKKLIADNSERLQKEASKYSKEESLLNKLGQ